MTVFTKRLVFAHCLVALGVLTLGTLLLGAGTNESAKLPSPVSDQAAAKAAVAADLQRPAAPLPVELQPYHVQLLIGFENVPQFDDEFRQSALDAVRDGLDRYVGEFWQCVVSEEQGTVFAGPAALKRLRAETIPQGALSPDAEKVYLLSVESSGAQFRVAGREWDVLTRRLGTIAVNSVYDRREIAETLLEVVHDLFRPIAAVEPSKSGEITLRARGGEFPPRDESWQPLPPGRTFEVFYCFFNKDRAIERVQQVPFTYLTAGEGAERGVAPGTVTSGLRAPLTARRRIQPVALGINRRGSETRLTLITRPPARKPLAGVEVEISPVPNPAAAASASQDEADNRHGADKKDAPLPRLVADRSGAVILSAGASPSGQPIWLLVKSGQALLARVPFVPGVQRAEVLELPDDSLRLETEGKVALLQAELVDAVARRAVLMSLAKSRAKTNSWEAVAELLRELDEMRKAPSFAADINAIRIPAMKAARARRDRTTEERIKQLCDETNELVTNYLDEEKLKELKEDLKEMQQLAADESAADALAKSGAPTRPAPEAKSAGTKKKKKKAAAARQPASPAPNKPPVGF